MDNDTRQQLVKFLAGLRAEGVNKAECTRQLGSQYPEHTRGDIIPILVDGIGISLLGASTYFHSLYAPASARSSVETSNKFGDDTDTLDSELPQVTTTELRIQLQHTAENAAQWYIERTQPIAREQFERRGGIKDVGRGAVYGYFTDEGALYIGITGYRVKSRLTTPTSPHAQTEWWKDWTEMRFLPMEASADRQTLEFLLILGLAPTINTKPSSISFDQFLGAANDDQDGTTSHLAG